MSGDMANRFIDALKTLEQKKDVEPLIALFSEDCEVSNLALHRIFRGKEGAREFWREYLGTLTDVSSRFRNVIESGSRIALEWVTTGKAFSGDGIEYEGVSILELAPSGGAISRFMAYFNPMQLGQELQPPSARDGQDEARADDVPRSQVPATAPA